MSALDRALEELKREARAAKVAKALPPDKRPSKFMIEIGMAPADEGIVGPSDDKATMIEAVPDDDDDED